MIGDLEVHVEILQKTMAAGVPTWDGERQRNINPHRGFHPCRYPQLSSILMGFSLINHPFWVPPLMEPHIYIYSIYIYIHPLFLDHFDWFSTPHLSLRRASDLKLGISTVLHRRSLHEWFNSIFQKFPGLMFEGYPCVCLNVSTYPAVSIHHTGSHSVAGVPFHMEVRFRPTSSTSTRPCRCSFGAVFVEHRPKR